MSKSFSNPTFYNSGKPTFGNLVESNISSDYLINKKAKLLYSNNNIHHKRGGLGSQANYLLFDRAKQIKNIESCSSIPYFNTSNLVSGLYSTEKLGVDSTQCVNVITSINYKDASCNVFSPVAIDLDALTALYNKYRIDPCGLLFGKTPCGKNNFNKFRVINKNQIKTSASLTNCLPLLR